MAFTPLTPEEDELLHLLEVGDPGDSDRVRDLTEILVDRHWRDLVAHVRKRCFTEEVDAEKIASDTFLKAYEILCQQMSQRRCALQTDCALLYSRARCPHFLGFVKALARWKHLHEARSTVRYTMLIHKFAHQEQQRTQQYGTVRARTSGDRVPLLPRAPIDDQPAALWHLVKRLSNREHLVVQLYFEYGPEPLNLQGLIDLSSHAGLVPQEIRPLQRRFRRILRGQRLETIAHLTQETIAAILDVDRDTIRRILLKGKKHLQSALVAELLHQ